MGGWVGGGGREEWGVIIVVVVVDVVSIIIGGRCVSGSSSCGTGISSSSGISCGSGR